MESQTNRHFLFLQTKTNLIFSDGTLNPNGVRFGSAEIYNVGKFFILFRFWKLKSQGLCLSLSKAGKHQPKMITLSDWTSKTKVIIVYDSFFRKPTCKVHYLSLLHVSF